MDVIKELRDYITRCRRICKENNMDPEVTLASLELVVNNLEEQAKKENAYLVDSRELLQKLAERKDEVSRAYYDSSDRESELAEVASIIRDMVKAKEAPIPVEKVADKDELINDMCDLLSAQLVTYQLSEFRPSGELWNLIFDNDETYVAEIAPYKLIPFKKQLAQTVVERAIRYNMLDQLANSIAQAKEKLNEQTQER